MRKSGILMNVGSLISDYGLGNIGGASFDFIDFLKEINQDYWQMLPVNQTEIPHNPYKPISSFAMEPNFIDFENFRKSSYLISEDLSISSISKYRTNIDYYNLKINNFKTLRRAYLRGQSWDIDDIREFREKNKYWIKYYAQYMCLKDHFKENNYMHWDLKARYPDQDHFECYKTVFSTEVYFWYFLQYSFYQQWKRLKKYAKKNNIELIGEMPSKVINASVDMWAYGIFFIKKRDGNNDYADHNWKEQKKDNYRWWQEKFRISKKMYNITKLTIEKDLDDYLKMLSSVNDTIEIGRIILEIKTEISKENLEEIKNKGYYLGRVIKTTNDDFIKNKNENGITTILYTSDNKKPLNIVFSEMSFSEKINEKKKLDKNVFSNINWMVVEAVLESEEDISIIALRDIIKRNKKVILEDVGGRKNNWSWRLGARSIDRALISKLERALEKTDRISEKK